MKKLLTLGLAALPWLATAHEGHGMPGASHWHATDSAGLLLVGVVVAALVWYARRK